MVILTSLVDCCIYSLDLSNFNGEESRLYFFNNLQLVNEDRAIIDHNLRLAFNSGKVYSRISEKMRIDLEVNNCDRSVPPLLLTGGKTTIIEHSIVDFWSCHYSIPDMSKFEYLEILSYCLSINKIERKPRSLGNLTDILNDVNNENNRKAVIIKLICFHFQQGKSEVFREDLDVDSDQIVCYNHSPYLIEYLLLTDDGSLYKIVDKEGRFYRYHVVLPNSQKCQKIFSPASLIGVYLTLDSGFHLWNSINNSLLNLDLLAVSVVHCSTSFDLIINLSNDHVNHEYHILRHQDRSLTSFNLNQIVKDITINNLTIDGRFIIITDELDRVYLIDSQIPHSLQQLTDCPMKL